MVVKQALRRGPWAQISRCGRARWRPRRQTRHAPEPRSAREGRRERATGAPRGGLCDSLARGGARATCRRGQAAVAAVGAGAVRAVAAAACPDLRPWSGFRWRASQIWPARPWDPRSGWAQLARPGPGCRSSRRRSRWAMGATRRAAQMRVLGQGSGGRLARERRLKLGLARRTHRRQTSRRWRPHPPRAHRSGRAPLPAIATHCAPCTWGATGGVGAWPTSAPTWACTTWRWACCGGTWTSTSWSPRRWRAPADRSSSDRSSKAAGVAALVAAAAVGSRCM
mmetsp:Transcript_26091/g.83941  ORF Transcript_26091/g.83941 Transcript_26091/m.83941 type:complete len:282 (+) Transcript_26091:207-1052(+)